MRAWKFLIALITIPLVASFLELYAGHEYILNPILLGKDPYFVEETYFAPAYYGSSKAVAIFLSTLIALGILQYAKVKKNFGYVAAFLNGVLGTSLFGYYYYLIRPPVLIESALLISTIHYVFIAFTTFIVLGLLERV